MTVSLLPRRIAAATLAVLATLVPCLIQSSPAAAAGGGYVRLAHLVPDKIACDMYIQLHSVTGDVVKYLPSIKYGTISEYVMVPAGTYAVAMRKPGAPATDKPALSTSLTVADGKAYTVARMGAPDHADARIIEDDRTLPANGKAKLRVVQAAQRTLDVSVVDGPVIAKDVAFTTATAYHGIDPGTRTLRVQPAGGEATTLKTAVTAGSIYSLLVLEAADGRVSAAVLADARREGPVPRGGVETGAGGSTDPAGHQASTTLAMLLMLAGAAVVLVLIGGALVARRPSRAPVPRR